MTPGIRLMRLVVLALAICVGGWIAIDAFRDWSLSDMEAYWNAALRLRNGEPLYQASYSVGAHDLYLYAPWFAHAWVPLTYLPRQLIAVAWDLLLALSAVVALWPTIRQRTLSATVIGILLGSLLLWTVAKANVHALLMAVLVLGLRSRWGPIAIALAASLKAAPLALVALYIGRRQWRRVAVTLAATVILVAPVLFFDLGGYPRQPGTSGSLWSLVHPALWLVAALIAFGAAVSLARTRYGWLAGSVAVIAAFPRLLDYDATLLLTASSDRTTESETAATDGAT